MSDNKLKTAKFFAARMRKDAYGLKTASGYAVVRQKLTPLVLEKHVDDVAPIGCYPLIGDKTSVAVLDFDDHDGTAGWSEVVVRVAAVIAAAVAHGLKPIPVRSGGGQGAHVWFFWEHPVNARYARRLLKICLAAAGLSDGTSGVMNRSAEIFPKQDRVTGDQLGNLVALPGARASVPLDPSSLSLIDWSAFDADGLSFRASVPPPEVVEEDVSSAAFQRLDGDEETVESALKHIPADNYDTWLRVALALKSTFGDDGLGAFDRWSATSPAKYDGPAKLEASWRRLNPRGVVGLGTIFHLAKKGGWNGPSNSMVREMNARFGILTHGNATQIIVKNGDRRPDDDIALLSKQVFIDRLEPEAIVSRDDNGQVTRRSKAREWLSHRHAAHYTRLDFDPSEPPGHNGKTWNLWTGFGVEPHPGDWSMLRSHVRENVARGDERVFRWLMNWMALAVQDRARPIGTAPVLIGLPGTGKGVLANAFARLWGQHAVSVTHAEHVTGRFSAHLFAKRFVFIDEGTFGGNRRDAGVIKTRITEPYVILERKGIDPIRLRNRMIFMVASNELSVVPADTNDRRWMVLEVGDKHREDHGYFAAIQRQLDEGGYEAMLHELLNRETSQGPDPRRAIKTAALFEQILLAAPPEVRFVHGILDQGRLPQNWISGPASATIKALTQDLRHAHREAVYMDANRLGRQIRKMIPGVQTAQNGKFFVMKDDAGDFIYERSTRYDFPSLAEARKQFERFVGMAVPWADCISEWTGDPEPEDPGVDGII